RIIRAVCGSVVRQSLFDYPATYRIVLIGEIDDSARVLNRKHAIGRVIGVFGDTVFGVGDLPKPPACIVVVNNRSTDIVSRLGNSSTGIVSKLDPAVVRRDDFSEFRISVSI